jgi:anti-sigma factor RsiW
MDDAMRTGTRDHEDILQWLSRELDGELADPQRILLNDHLDGCPRCATVAAQWRSLRRALAADARAQPPEVRVGVVDRILAHVQRAEAGEESAVPLAETAAPGSRRAVVLPFTSTLRRSAALAAGLLALIGTLYVARGPTTAVATGTGTIKTSDAALMRVLDRWQRGRRGARRPSSRCCWRPPATKSR